MSDSKFIISWAAIILAVISLSINGFALLVKKSIDENSSKPVLEIKGPGEAVKVWIKKE